MKTLQITLFLIANVIFISQSARHVHQLMFGVETSILDKFDPETEKVRSEKDFQVLITDYKVVLEEIRSVEKGKKSSEVADVRQQHEDLYTQKSALRSEISEREQKSKNLRDLWIFSGFGFLLIFTGAIFYRWLSIWPGFSFLVTGFCILEYWTSPTFFGGGASAEFHQLLIGKTLLTLAAFSSLHVLWKFKDRTSGRSSL